MADRSRNDRNVQDKRAALAGGQPRAYNHGDQVGGSRVRLEDGQWVDRAQTDRPQANRPQADRPQSRASHARRSQTQRSGRTPQRRARSSAAGRAPEKQGSIGAFVANNIVYILSVVAVAVIVVLLVFGVRMFVDLTSPLETQSPDEYDSPYNWSNLVQEEGRYAYVVDGKVKSRFGVDVAEDQGVVDWQTAADNGVEFAMLRLGYRGATEGGLYVDEQIESNLANTQAAGIDRGVYFFSQAITVDEAREEAEFVLDYLNGAALEYPIAFDWELVHGIGDTRTDELNDEDLSEIAKAFCERIERAGYRTLVYGNAHDLRSYDIDLLTKRDIWWAEYDASEPSHYTDIVIWQYSESGSVAGIEGAVDMNIDLSNALK